MMENKSCENCYYSISEHPRSALRNIISNFCHYQVEQPTDKICEHHEFGCRACSYGDEFHEIALYKHNGKLYCETCCAEAIGIELRPYTAYQFYDSHGDFIGDSENTTLQDVLLNCSAVEYVGDDE